MGTKTMRYGKGPVPFFSFQGFPLNCTSMKPKGLREIPRSLVPPLFSTVTILGRRCFLVLGRKKRRISRDFDDPELFDTLFFDTQGDGAFDGHETYRLDWAFTVGKGIASTPAIRAGKSEFIIQVVKTSRDMEVRLKPLSLHYGKGEILGKTLHLFFLDMNLDGKAGGEDLWLLAAEGDQRLGLRMLDRTCLREGDVPFPLLGIGTLALIGLDDEDNALLVSRDAYEDDPYLAKRAERVRRQWESIFSYDEETRRKRLGLPEKGNAGRIHINWKHTIYPLSVFKENETGKPVLFFLDLENSTECRRLEFFTLEQGEVAEKVLSSFFPVHVPMALCPRDPRERWGFVSLPAVLVTDAEGNLLGKTQGFLGPGKLLEFLSEYGAGKD